MGERGMVVSDAKLATEVGQSVLRRGGNAMDAAVATAFALAVVYPQAGNLGGGGFAVVHTKQGEAALDFRETAPSSAARDMFREKKDASRVGHLASGVPGSVAGLVELHRVYGRLSLKELLAPAIKLAKEGFVVDEELSSTLAEVKERLQLFDGSRELFFREGATLQVGSVLQNPDLEKVLRGIEETGDEDFYRGETASLIAEEMRRGGGLITEADLGSYHAIWRSPIRFTYRGHTVVSMPPPSSGGITLGMIAHVLEPVSLSRLGFLAPRAVHETVEAMRRAFAFRNARLGDPSFWDNPTDELLSRAWADRARASIQEGRATASQDIRVPDASGAGPHTTHLGTADDEGNVVALTTTVNFWYGSGVTVRGGGFLLNNEMDDFATSPGEPNGFGLVQGESNAIEPGKRPLSSMTPTLVFSPNGEPKLVLGAAGGPTIITSVFHVMSGVLDYGMDLGQAVSAPRFHEQHLPDEIVYEEHGFSSELLAELRKMGHSLKSRRRIGDAPAIMRSPGTWIGAAEVRRKGTLALGVP